MSEEKATSGRYPWGKVYDQWIYMIYESGDTDNIHDNHDRIIGITFNAETALEYANDYWEYLVDKYNVGEEGSRWKIAERKGWREIDIDIQNQIRWQLGIESVVWDERLWVTIVKVPVGAFMLIPPTDDVKE